jgi:hypothetical protein
MRKIRAALNLRRTLYHAGFCARLRHSTFQADWGGGSLKGDKTLGLAAGFSQPCQIGLHLMVGFEGLQSGVQDGGCSGVIGTPDAVVHPFAFSACVDDAGVAKIGEVSRYFGLALFENFYEVADAHFAAIHQIEQTKAGRVGEGGEEANQIRRFGGAAHISKYTP